MAKAGLAGIHESSRLCHIDDFYASPPNEQVKEQVIRAIDVEPLPR